MPQSNRVQPRPISLTIAFFVAALAAFGVLAPASRAASVGIDSWHQTVYYVAGSAEANGVTVSLASGKFEISDPGVNLTAQYGCTLTDSHHASCSSTYVKWIYVSAGDLDDSVALQTATPAYVNCGTGSDSVTSLLTTSQYLTPVGCESVNAPPPPAAPSPVPATPPAPPASSPLVIQHPVATMTAGGSVPVPLDCAASASTDCTGTLIFQLPGKSASGRRAAASRRGGPNILGRKEISLHKGSKKNVNVSMTSRGRGLVKRHHRLHVTVLIKLKQGGTVTTSSQALTIKAPRASR